MPRQQLNETFDAHDDQLTGDFVNDGLDELDLPCPGCGADLTDDRVFETWGICPSCRRHFWITGRERMQLLLDRDSFRETNGELLSLEPLVFRDAAPSAESLQGSPLSASLSEAVVTGIGRIGGRDTVLIMVDFAHLGNAIGVVTGEKIALAFELAISRRLPVLAICSAGAARGPEAALSLLQATKIASLVTRLRRASVPFVSVLTHPTTGSVYSGFANLADFVFSEPGALIGASLNREAPAMATGQHAEEMLLAGMIDDVVDRTTLRDRMVALLEILESRGAPRHLASPSSPVTPLLRSGEVASIAFHPGRPGARDYVRFLMPVFLEFHGDRASGDDSSVITGFGKIDGVSMAVIAHDHLDAADHTTSRIRPTGFRKAVRLVRLAARFDLPLLIFIDTHGAAAGEEDSAGIGVALSQLVSALTAAPVPVISVITGAAGGSAAMAFTAGDRVLMQENAVMLTTTVDLARQRGRDSGAPPTRVLLTARDCERIGLVHTIVPEPAGGAQVDLQSAAMQLRLAILFQLSTLTNLGTRRMLEERARHSRGLGLSTPEGTEAARLEIAQLQEIHRSLERSFGDLRARLDQHNLNLPAMPQLPHVAGLPQLPVRPAMPAMPALRRPAVSRQEISGLADRLAATGRDFADRMNEAAGRAGVSSDSPPPPEADE